MRAQRIRIERDRWGVPHIHAETELGALFGQGYATAQDRLETMMGAYRRALGRAAEVFGADWVDHDFEQRTFRHGDIAQQRYAEQSEFQQRATEAFLAGVGRYLTDHPEREPDCSIELHRYLPLALARYLIWRLVLEQAEAKLAGPSSGDPARGSNAWAVSARRTEQGHAILFIDPHARWADEGLVHEVHLAGGDLHVYGFQHPGLPYVAYGHNEHLAWTFTAGGPDATDVYELMLDPSDPRRYAWEGDWRTLGSERISIPVKTPAGVELQTRELLRSHHGPILRADPDRAYAVKTAYDGLLFEHGEVYAQINKAAGLDSFRAALSMGMLAPINVVSADTEGNIYYRRTGLAPERSEGWPWCRPVRGDTADTEWRGIRDPEDLVELLNPAAGWLQCCNVPPDQVTRPSPLRSEDYPRYLFEDPAGRRGNPRGERASELLASDGRLSLERALAIANDTFVTGGAPWLRWLREVTDPELEEAVGILRDWDACADADSVGATLYFTWWRALAPRLEPRVRDEIQRGGAPTPESRGALVDALREACDELRQRHGDLRVPWGRVYRASRGGVSWPLAGGLAGEWATVTLRTIRGGAPDRDGVIHGRFGQVCPTVVVLKRGDVRAHTAVPFGESDVPDSPHATDQGRLLFARRQFKRARFARADLEGPTAPPTILHWRQS